jgi:hypothetical protein
MAVQSKRRTFINLMITNLKEIDGGVSPFDLNYTFLSNVFNNVSRGHGNFENINDYPTIKVIAGPERYTYNTVGNTSSSLILLLRCYLKNGDRSSLKAEVDNLIQDIDHVIYKMPTDTDNLQQVLVTEVDSDQGLLEDYAVVEIKLLLTYELSNI